MEYISDQARYLPYPSPPPPTFQALKLFFYILQTQCSFVSHIQQFLTNNGVTNRKLLNKLLYSTFGKGHKERPNQVNGDYWKQSNSFWNQPVKPKSHNISDEIGLLGLVLDC